MATKAKFFVNRLKQEIDGYKVTDHLGLYLDPNDNLWRGCHLKTGDDLVGPNGTWKRKRACLAFVESFIDLDWEVENEEEMYERNGGFESLVEMYKQAVNKGRELE